MDGWLLTQSIANSHFLIPAAHFGSGNKNTIRVFMDCVNTIIIAFHDHNHNNLPLLFVYYRRHRRTVDIV